MLLDFTPVHPTIPVVVAGNLKQCEIDNAKRYGMFRSTQSTMTSSYESSGEHNRNVDVEALGPERKDLGSCYSLLVQQAAEPDPRLCNVQNIGTYGQTIDYML